MIPPVTQEKTYDVVGLGLNAVDYLCVVPYFPRFNSKLKMVEFQKQGGGQVATALVALSRWGMRTSYIGKVGDDDLGRFTRQELLKEGVDIIHPKTSELLSLTDVLISDQEFPSDFTRRADRREALQDLMALGPREVVMTLGKEGALALSSQGFYYCPGFEVTAVDTTEAGDLFHAGFIYGMFQGWSFEARVTFANAASALKCRYLGGRAGIPTLQEIETFLSRVGR